MEKINIAELLKDCPKGMKLYSPIFGEVYFDRIRPHLAIVVVAEEEQGDFKEEFLYDGRYGMNGECMLFPSKGKTTWEGFVPPCQFKDGDVISNGKFIAIFHKFEDNRLYYRCWHNKTTKESKYKTDFGIGYYYEYTYATEEEKEKLFQAIKEEGYYWDAENNILEVLLDEPKFKVGNVVRLKSKPNYIYTIHSLTWDDNKKLAYRLLPKNDKHLILVSLDKQDNYELVPDRFDINTLKPYDKVLVRGGIGQKWTHDFFGFMDKNRGYPFVCVGHYVMQCIPYEGNEHLLGKTEDCDEFYKTWE